MNAETKLKYKFVNIDGRKYVIDYKFIGVVGMTREEAVKKVRGAACASSVLADQILDAIKALGLIKFKEEKLGPVAAVKYCRNQYDDTGLMLEKLETDFGYKIVKV